MRPALLLLALLVLAACGANGAPERPGPRSGEARTTIDVSGTASIGVSGRS